PCVAALRDASCRPRPAISKGLRADNVFYHSLNSPNKGYQRFLLALLTLVIVVMITITDHFGAGDLLAFVLVLELAIKIDYVRGDEEENDMQETQRRADNVFYHPLDFGNF